MKQCILTVAAWLLHSDSAPSVTLNLAEQYPPMEAQGPIPDLLRKVLTAYETVSTVLPGLGSSRGCSVGPAAPGPPPFPRWGIPNSLHPSRCRGRLVGDCVGGCPGRSLVEVQAHPARYEPWDPAAPVPLPALPAPCARASWRGVLQSRLAGEIPLIAAAGAASFLCVGGGPGRRPGTGHTAPGCTWPGEEGQTPATTLRQGAAPA